ncbi:MAG: hypothetical protein VX697_03630, partial [Pseudomonadota bacterium]|nr:hypothetical protein [Pseudomonadota bacterium]
VIVITIVRAILVIPLVRIAKLSMEQARNVAATIFRCPRQLTNKQRERYIGRIIRVLLEDKEPLSFLSRRFLND